MHFARELFRDVCIDVVTVGLVLSFYLFTYGHRTFSRLLIFVGLGLVLVTAVGTLAAVFAGSIDRAGNRLRQWAIACVAMLLVLTAGTQSYGWGTDFKFVAIEVYLIGIGFIGSSAVVALLVVGLMVRSVIGLQTGQSSPEEIRQDVLDSDDSGREQKE